MLCGTLVSIFVPETKRQTLEVLAGGAPFSAREGSNKAAGGQDGLIYTLAKFLGLSLHSPAKNEIQIGTALKSFDTVDSHCFLVASTVSRGKVKRLGRSGFHKL